MEAIKTHNSYCVKFSEKAIASWIMKLALTYF